MPNQQSVSLDVAIMGREFRVACPESERESLLQAVSFLDKRMREIRDGGKVIGIERIAIMAALNITHDYLNDRGGAPDTHDIRKKLAHLGNLVDDALTQQDKLF